MPSETGIAVTQGETPRKRGRPRKFAATGLMRLTPDADDLYALYASGNARLSDDDLERLCGITPAMVYALRDIAEGRVGKGAMATIEAFSKMAEIGHRPAKGRAKVPDADAGKTVIFNIAIAEIRPEVAAGEPKLVLDVQPQPETEKTEVPTISITVNE